MDKETAKKIICDFIDQADEVQEVSISEDYEEIDVSTLEKEKVIRKPTGLTNMFVTIYKEGD